MKKKYDFIFSFAGEDRSIVEQVRDVLNEHGLSVFYDLDEQHQLLGKDLADYFAYLYSDKAKYCVVFVSKAYINKPWCRWERRSILARAFKNADDYLIPYFLENCSLPSIPNTIGRADLKTVPPRDFALLLTKKYYNNADSNELDPKNILSNSSLENLNTSLGYKQDSDKSKHLVKTGFVSVDKKLGHSLKPRSIYIVGSRYAIGKTMFALNIVNYNIKTGNPVIYLSVGETVDYLTLKLISIRERIPMFNLRHNKISEKELLRVNVALNNLNKEPLSIISFEYETAFDQILCELWHVAKYRNPRLIVIDDLQSLGGEMFFGMNRNIGPKTVLRALKWLVTEINCTCIVNSQLCRSLESRLDRTPKISYLYGGGKNISYFAHACFLLYRESYYRPRRENPSDTLQVYITRANGKRLLPVPLVRDGTSHLTLFDMEDRNGILTLEGDLSLY